MVLVVEVEDAGAAMAVVLVLVTSAVGTAEARTTTGGGSSVERSTRVTSTRPAANTAATRAHISRLMARW
jgi:hypothetical protein